MARSQGVSDCKGFCPPNICRACIVVRVFSVVYSAVNLIGCAGTCRVRMVFGEVTIFLLLPVFH